MLQMVEIFYETYSVIDTSPLHDANNILVQIFLYSHPCTTELIAEDDKHRNRLHIVAVLVLYIFL